MSTFTDIEILQRVSLSIKQKPGSQLTSGSQTPMPYIIAVHMKQATTMLLFVLPFTLVDTLKATMIPLMFFIALIYMGDFVMSAFVDTSRRHRRNCSTSRAALRQVGQLISRTHPKYDYDYSDPCDLNLDLYCTGLLCECE